MADLAHYLWTLISGSWALISAGLFGGADKIIEHAMPSVKAWLDRRLPASRRRALVLWAIFLAFIFSGYRAFSAEHNARLAAEDQIRREESSVGILRSRLAARPPVEKETIVREIPIPEKAPLTRNLKRENIQILQEIYAKDGSKAPSMDQYYSTKAAGILLQFRNIGSDTIRWKVGSIKIRFPDGATARAVGLKQMIVLAGDRSELQYKLDRKVLIRRSLERIGLSISLEYDTIPASGVRRSMLNGIVPVIWTPPQPNNNPVDAAGLASFVVESDKER